MSLFTVLLDFKGGTYVAQVRAGSAKAAVRRWAETLDPAAIQGFGRSSHRALISQARKDSSVPLDHLKGIWCLSALVRGRLALVHIIRTAA